MHAANGPASGEDTAPERSSVTYQRAENTAQPGYLRRRVCCRLNTLRTDQLDWSLPAHRRGTLRGMDAA
ncbi:hypothetical protein XcodCFBP4690_05175 [Xanthomonas codiaei]|uniref:Uncharacterized protein n=1 Tax=Xanthomonas codiaei TaxID=56463 RepID=A0A2S7CUZ5_9XANT|nr:hypothetical protein XcodCFBP4690_05175 [Xanthomonas codiaei]